MSDELLNEFINESREHLATEPDRIRLFGNIARCLARDGSLIIGSTESIAGFCPEFEPKRHLRSVFYQLKGAS